MPRKRHKPEEIVAKYAMASQVEQNPEGRIPTRSAQPQTAILAPYTNRLGKSLTARFSAPIIRA